MAADPGLDTEQPRESLRRAYELVLSQLGESSNSAFTLRSGILELGRRAHQADHGREMQDEIARLDLLLEAESLREEIVFAWHAGAFGDRDLQDVLGLDDEAYSTWVARGPKALEGAREQAGDRPTLATVEEAAERLEELEGLDTHTSTIHYVLGEVHEIAKLLRRGVRPRP